MVRGKEILRQCGEGLSEFLKSKSALGAAVNGRRGQSKGRWRVGARSQRARGSAEEAVLILPQRRIYSVPAFIVMAHVCTEPTSPGCFKQFTGISSFTWHRTT